jgi:hypothetical protein
MRDAAVIEHVLVKAADGGHDLPGGPPDNLGAFPAYGGMADFFVNGPETFTAAAGTSAQLPSIGHTGFVLRQNQETVITCPKLWQPTSAADLALSMLVVTAAANRSSITYSG